MTNTVASASKIFFGNVEFPLNGYKIDDEILVIHLLYRTRVQVSLCDDLVINKSPDCLHVTNFDPCVVADFRLAFANDLNRQETTSDEIS